MVEVQYIIFLKIFGIEKSGHRLSIFNGVRAYLYCNGYSFVPTKKYQDEFNFRCDIQPLYVLIVDDEILNKYINEAPVGLKKTEKKKWIKIELNKILNMINLLLDGYKIQNAQSLMEFH